MELPTRPPHQTNSHCVLPPNDWNWDPTLPSPSVCVLSLPPQSVWMHWRIIVLGPLPPLSDIIILGDFNADPGSQGAPLHHQIEWARENISTFHGELEPCLYPPSQIPPIFLSHIWEWSPWHPLYIPSITSCARKGSFREWTSPTPYLTTTSTCQTISQLLLLSGSITTHLRSHRQWASLLRPSPPVAGTQCLRKLFAPSTPHPFNVWETCWVTSNQQ